MIRQSIFQLPVLVLLLLLLHCCITLAQSPAPAPAPAAGPTNVIKILKKSGKFKSFIRLLKKTQLDSNLNSQLGDTNNGLTIFAPSDTAFSSLKQGTLSKLTNQQKLELAQFHIIPTYIPSSTFDTVSNPLKTHAGSGGRFQLNVTSVGNSVNISTGLTNTTISDTVYTDRNLAIYEVDKVLLPLDIFTPLPPAPAPAVVKEKADAESPSDDHSTSRKDVSNAVSLVMQLQSFVFLLGVGLVSTSVFAATRT